MKHIFKSIAVMIVIAATAFSGFGLSNTLKSNGNRMTANAASSQEGSAEIEKNAICEDLTLQTFNSRDFTGSTVNKGDVYKSAIYVIAEFPGPRVEKDGWVVYGDSVNLCFYSAAEENGKIDGSKRRINYSTATSISKNFLGESGMINLGRQLGNGFAYIKRDTALGGIEEYYLYDIFSSIGMKDTKRAFQMEGEYWVTICFETFQWGGFLGLFKSDFQTHQLSYRFKVRRSDAKVALIDREITNEVNYVQKNTVTNSEDIQISYNGNQYITVSYDYTPKPNKGGEAKTSVSAPDGHEITESGTYLITVQNDTFITEKFQVVIDADAVVGIFSNLRKITSLTEAEAEAWVSLTWEEDPPAQIACTVSFNGGNEVSYTKGYVLDNPGVYNFTISKYSNLGALMFTTKYTITVVPADYPTHNHDILLNPYRFNNFISKWYQVYDFNNDRIICLADAEEAYEAAMSLEFDRVTVKTLTNASMFTEHDKLAPGEVVTEGEYYVYYNEYEGQVLIYFSEVSVTKAMDKNAKNNSKLAYYDITKPNIEMEFEKVLFTNDNYINSDFVFASLHPAIIEKMEYFHVESMTGGTVYYEFNTYNGVGYIRASDYFTKHGTYNIIETDNLGNSVSYSVVNDLKAPEVFISIDDGDITQAIDGQTYDVSQITFNSFFDDLDSQAVIKIGDQYFWQSELNDYVLTAAGIYEIVAYDRSGNILRFTVIIDGTMEASIERANEESNLVKVYINPFITSYDIIINGADANKKLIFDVESNTYYLLFEGGNIDTDIQIVLYNKLDETDIQSLNFSIKAVSTSIGGNGGDTTGPNIPDLISPVDEPNNLLLYLSIGGGVIILAGAAFFIIKRRSSI